MFDLLLRHDMVLPLVWGGRGRERGIVVSAYLPTSEQSNECRYLQHQCQQKKKKKKLFITNCILKSYLNITLFPQL